MGTNRAKPRPTCKTEHPLAQLAVDPLRPSRLRTVCALPNGKDLEPTRSEFLGAVYVGAWEYDYGHHYNTFRLHINPIIMIELYKALGLSVPKKPSQVGAIEMIHCFWNLFGNYQEFCYEPGYDRLNFNMVTPSIYMERTKIPDYCREYFWKGVMGMPSDRPVVDLSLTKSRRFRGFIPYAPGSIYNDFRSVNGTYVRRVLTPDEQNQASSYSERLSKEQASQAARDAGRGRCVMKMGCRNQMLVPNEIRDERIGMKIIFFEPGTQEFNVALKWLGLLGYHDGSICVEKLKSASNQLGLQTEHLIPKTVCKTLGIDPDFPGNHNQACKRCNPSNKILGKLNLREKLDLIWKYNHYDSKYVRTIYRPVLDGLLLQGETNERYFDIFREYHKEFRTHGWYD